MPTIIDDRAGIYIAPTRYLHGLHASRGRKPVLSSAVDLGCGYIVSDENKKKKLLAKNQFRGLSRSCSNIIRKGRYAISETRWTSNITTIYIKIGVRMRK